MQVTVSIALRGKFLLEGLTHPYLLGHMIFKREIKHQRQQNNLIVFYMAEPIGCSYKLIKRFQRFILRTFLCFLLRLNAACEKGY